MRNEIQPDLAPAELVFSTGRRHTLDIDTVDCELLISALQLIITTRGAGKVIGTNTDDTPAADARELALLELLQRAGKSEHAHSTT